MNFPEDVWHHMPGWAAAALLILIGVVHILSKLSQAYEPVAKAIPILGKYWRNRGARHDVRVDAELEDLRRQVNFLGLQLGELRVRDEMYWAWILVDQEWHRQHEFDAAREGRETVPHTPFMEFRDRWMSTYYSGVNDRRRHQEEAPF